MGREIHLLVPDLLPKGLGGSGINLPPLSALETLLARADRGPQLLTDPDEYVCALSGFDGENAPLGALCRLADTGRRDERWWFRAEPVHLAPDRDRLCLQADRPDLSSEEAEGLVAELNAHFCNEGLELEIGTPSRWYLAVREIPALRTCSPERLGGVDVRHHLPTGEDALRWHARLNEIQMLLHASVVNAERQARGLLPVTGVWLWGGGVLPRVAPYSAFDIWADSGACASRGLARLTGGEVRDLPDSIGPVCTSSNERSIVIATVFSRFLRRRDFNGWLSAVERWEVHWFGPLLNGLRRGTISRLELHGGGNVRFVLTSRHVWRFWRRRRSLAQVEQSAGFSHVE